MAPDFAEDIPQGERVRWSNALANFPLLDDASAESVDAILKGARFRRVTPGEILMDAQAEAASVFFLLDGAVRVFQRSEQGTEYSPKFLKAPTHFGDLTVMAGIPEYRSSIAALTPCVLAEVNATMVDELVSSDAPLCRAWLRSVAQQFCITIDLLRQSMFGDLASQMSNVLLSYEDAVTAPDTLDLSYNELAQQAGCTRRSAINIMNKLVNNGIARRDDRGRWTFERDRATENLLPGRLSLTHSLDEPPKE